MSSTIQYRACNLTRKECVTGEFADVMRLVAALVCNDLLSLTIGRWAGDRVVMQRMDARPGVASYVSQRDLRNYVDITAQLA